MRIQDFWIFEKEHPSEVLVSVYEYNTILRGKNFDVFGENEVATKTITTLSELNPFEVGWEEKRFLSHTLFKRVKKRIWRSYVKT